MGLMDAETRLAMHQNSIEGLTRVARALPGARVATVGPWLLFDSGTGDAQFNQALVAGETAGEGDEAIGAAERWFRGRSGFVLWLREPDDRALIQAALRAGYLQERLEPAMLLERLEGAWPSPAGLDVRAVDDDEGAAAYAEADAEEGDRFEARRDGDESLARAVMTLAGMRLFVGYVAGVPVARSMLVLSGEMAGVTNVYVAPSVRRRGFGTAMTARAIGTGAEMGATRACLEASTMGRPLYERMGFREIYRYVRLRRPSGR
jgi:GNAT superfamily N-acetyltransferase